LQVTLCDPCLSALSVRYYKNALYNYTYLYLLLMPSMIVFINLLSGIRHKYMATGTTESTTVVTMKASSTQRAQTSVEANISRMKFSRVIET